MSLISFLGKVAFSALFIVAGVMHFSSERFFVEIMPPYLPYPRVLVHLSGIVEIVLGILLLIPPTSRAAAWGLIVLLIAVFPANIHVFQNQDLFPAPRLVHAIRLVLQLVLILWAYWYTRPAPVAKSA